MLAKTFMQTLWFIRMGILHIYGLSYLKVKDKSLHIKITHFEVGTLFESITFSGNFDWICNLRIQELVLKNLELHLKGKPYHW